MAKYLTKYLSSPTISLKRIKEYNKEAQTVEYVYKSHQSGKIEKEKVDVFTFIGRMVQQILPKGFQRIRYFGLHATKIYKKYEQILTGLFKKVTQVAKGCYKVIKKRYRDRYKEANHGKDPFICSQCGSLMEVSAIWSPKHGFIYDWLEQIKSAPPVTESKAPPVEPETVISQGVQLVFDFFAHLQETERWIKFC